MAMVSRTLTNGKSSTSTITMALIYTRVSTDEQAREGLSLEAQLTDCRRYVAQHGWIIGAEYADILSGKRDDRPYYRALLDEARRLRTEGTQVVIVVKWLHRLGRRVLERVRSREEMKAIGVTLHSIAEGGEVSDLVANILASVAEEEVRQLGERVSAVRQHAGSNGWAFPGRHPWGYQFRPAVEDERQRGAPKSVLDLDPDEAPFVREAWRRVVDGESVRKVANWASLLPSSARGERSLAYQAVRLMLSSPTYVARPPIGDPDVLQRRVGRWPAMVDDATWQRAQERIGDHKHVPHQATGRYLLTGLLRCPRCGARVAGMARKGRRSAQYACNGQGWGANAPRVGCRGSVTVDAIDPTVLADVGNLIALVTTATPQMQASLRAAWNALATVDATSDAALRLSTLEREAEKSRTRLKNAARKLVDGEIDKEGYDFVRDEARADLDAAEGELARLRPQHTPAAHLPDLAKVLADLGGWNQAFQDAPIAQQREVLAVLVDRVDIERVRRGAYRVEITWTPLGETLSTLARTVAAA